MVTPSGLPVLVECKLWRNAEARRELVGQILDYAKELTRFTVSDLQRETSRRLRLGPSALLDLVRAAAPELDEVEFNDNLTANLRRGRFLLLLVGDGIRERVESIAEYLQAHAGLHFSFGLVELPIYALSGGGRLVAPRVLAHTTVITRTVVALPDGHVLQETQDAATESEIDPETAALGEPANSSGRSSSSTCGWTIPTRSFPGLPGKATSPSPFQRLAGRAGSPSIGT